MDNKKVLDVIGKLLGILIPCYVLMQMTFADGGPDVPQAPEDGLSSPCSGSVVRGRARRGGRPFRRPPQ